MEKNKGKSFRRERERKKVILTRRRVEHVVARQLVKIIDDIGRNDEGIEASGANIEILIEHIQTLFLNVFIH